MRPLHHAAVPAILAATIFVSTTTAQVSEHFVMAGDQSTFHVIQGGVLVRSWSPAAGTAHAQYPLVVTGTVRTMGANAGDVGAEYDLNGNDLGPRFTHPAGPARCWDGTTDGRSHYTIDSNGDVYRYDRDWGNPTQLFDAGGIGSLTYDPATGSLFVSQFSTTTITQYSLTGVVLSSFSTGHAQNMALALDHADGTLWLHDRTTRGTFEQWTTSGTMLARIAVPGMSAENALGGEMQFPDSATCTARNGSGINPADFACETLPVLGTNWTTSFNVNANTLATALVLGPGGPATIPFQGGEILVALSPPPVIVTGTGNIQIPIPAGRFAAGVLLSTQGIRVDAGARLVLLNAQDIRMGF